MKLVRLTTTNPLCIFDNQFRDEILLKPNSQIALQNISIETFNSTIEIDSQNNQINFSVNGDAFSKQIILNYGEYDASNASDLLNEIKNKINATMIYNQATPERRILGIEWNTEINKDNKISIQYLHATFGEAQTEWRYPNDIERRNVNTRNAWGVFGDPTFSNNNLVNTMTFPDYMSRGNGGIRARIHKSVYNPTGGTLRQNVIIGLTTKDLSLSQSIVKADITYGVTYYSVDGIAPTNYFTYENGVVSGTGQAINYVNAGNTQNDTINVEINGNKVRAIVWRNGVNLPIVLREWDYTPGQELFPFITFNAGTNYASVNSVRVNPSPYSQHKPPIADLDPDDNEIQLGAPPIPQRTAGDNFLIFQSENLAKFLGFVNVRTPIIGFENAVNFNFIAPEKFEPSDISDAFLIELMTLSCDSYDGFLSQRKNILYVVPKSNADGELIYEPPNLLFIDLNNSREIALRNIRIRCVKNDYTPLNMKGLATMTLIFN